MKKGIDLGLTIIKCQNKSGTDSLKELHHQVNDVFFPNTYRYIDHKLANRMYDELCVLGKKLSDLRVPESAAAKKAELLTELRKRCKILKEYKEISNTVEDVPQMQSNLNWFVHTYIDAKKNDNIKPQEVLDLLVESRRLWDAFSPFEQHLRTDHFIKANGELLRWFESKYSIRELD